MKNEPIPVQPQRSPRKSRGGMKVAGAVTAGVLALGGAAAFAADHIGAEAGSHSGTTAETEKSLPASDLFGVTKPTPEPTPVQSATTDGQPAMTTPTRTISSSHVTQHETEHESDHSTSGSGSGGDD
ncbi:MAG TPA: hypothetical protein VLS53_04010 [Candidatus Dormibacteraeota bacterium]|nr:hypothetical protein [Candidatus Dormibacteraeota bacterium]